MLFLPILWPPTLPTRPSSNASPPIGTSMKTPYGAHSWPSLDSMRRSSPLILQQQLSQILCAPLPMPYRLPHPDQILHHFTTCIPFLCVPRIFLPTPNWALINPVEINLNKEALHMLANTKQCTTHTQAHLLHIYYISCTSTSSPSCKFRHRQVWFPQIFYLKIPILKTPCKKWNLKMWTTPNNL